MTAKENAEIIDSVLAFDMKLLRVIEHGCRVTILCVKKAADSRDREWLDGREYLASKTN
jgi:hypothetical protein